MTTMLSTCMIIDEPLELDRRVRSALSEQLDVRVVNLTSHRQTSADFAATFAAARILLSGLIAGVQLFPKLRKLLKPYPHSDAFIGLRAAWRWAHLAAVCRNDLTCTSAIHANDLYCAVAALFAAPKSAHFVYDSHEIQFHRNRKSGWLRILVEAGLERLVLERADELRVVSHHIARLMQELYGSLPPVRVVYNDFYVHQDPSAPPADAPLSIVYVGKGLGGRLLEALDCATDDLGAEFFIYPLGASLPPNISGAHWRFGPMDYESHLLTLVRSRRCLMWCCHENRCLSYTYALPNKFFQALAVGMPVIALRGTYLATLVEQYGLGLIYDGREPLGQLLDEVACGCIFLKWRLNTLRFREKIVSGTIEI